MGLAGDAGVFSKVEVGRGEVFEGEINVRVDEQVMAEERVETLTAAQRRSLLRQIRLVLPGAEYAPGESWDGVTSVEWQGQCECGVADVNTDDKVSSRRPAHVVVFVAATFPRDKSRINERLRLRRLADLAIEQWCERELRVAGCGVCGGELEVQTYYFQRKVAS